MSHKGDPYVYTGGYGGGFFKGEVTIVKGRECMYTEGCVTVCVVFVCVRERVRKTSPMSTHGQLF